MKYPEVLNIYDKSDFKPKDVPTGIVWRRRAMRDWKKNKRRGLIPLVSDSVPDLGLGHCYSCAAKIEEEDSGEGGVGDNRWCPECFVALETTLK